MQCIVNISFETELNLKLIKQELIEDLKELLTLAMSVGCADAAKELGEAVDEVGAARTSAITSVRGARTELGIPMGAVVSNINMNIKAPHFKGDYKEKMDFLPLKDCLMSIWILLVEDY